MYVIGYTQDELIQQIPEILIYSYYLGTAVKVGHPMLSPLRSKDHSPSFSIFYSRKNLGKLMYKDFGTGESGDCVQFVRSYLNLKSTKEAKFRIISDLVGNTTTQTRSFKFEAPIAQEKAVIVLEEQEFTQTDIEYWGKLFVTPEILTKFNIVSVHKVWINDCIKWVYSEFNPIYGYKFKDSVKCYRPLGGKGNKFRTNCSTHDIQGYEQLPENGDMLIITKSMKDVVTLYALGYTAIAPGSEGAAIPADIMEDLQQRFRKIYILYDNDKAGIETSNKLAAQYNIPNIFIPDQYGSKDISDLTINLQDKDKITEIITNVTNNV